MGFENLVNLADNMTGAVNGLKKAFGIQSIVPESAEIMLIPGLFLY